MLVPSFSYDTFFVSHTHPRNAGAVKKCDDSPSIEGYDSFILKPKEIWNSAEEIEAIELSFFITKTGATPPEMSESDEFQVVEIGDTFKLNLTDADAGIGGSFADNILALEWDFSNILMKEVATPREQQVLKRELEVSDDLLLLGMHGGQNFDPSEKLAVHVHLNDYLNGRHGKLRLKLYKDCEIEPDVLKTFYDMANMAIQKACTCNEIGSFSASTSDADYVTFVIDPNSLLQAIKESADNYFVSLLQEHEDEVNNVQTIIDAIETSKFAAVIEDGSSGQKIAEFLMSSITCNEVYFDSAVEMLKAPTSYENIADWSMMVTRTEESIWDSMYTHADYKLTRIESVPLEPEPGDKMSQEFVLKFAVPDIDTDLFTVPDIDTGVVTIDPYKDIAILVENRDDDFSFVGRDENREFLLLRNPLKLAKEGNDHMMEFKWSGIHKGDNEPELETKVSFIIELENRRARKIGRTVSFARDVGGTSKRHTAMVRMRHMVKNGIEKANEIQCNISHFVEETFKMVFALSSSDKLDLSRRLFVENAADDIASKFYRVVANNGRSGIYASIKNSSLLTTPDLDILDNVKQIEESEVAAFILEVFGHFGNYDLLGWAQSMRDDEAVLSMVQGDQTIDQLLQKHVENIRRVLGMSANELTTQLQGHPELMQDFINAAQLVRNEIDGKTIDVEDLDIPDFDEERYNNLSQLLNESNAKKIESQTAEILASMEEEIQSSVFSEEYTQDSKVYMEKVSISK